MKIVFFGSSSYCLPVLECLKHNFQLISVITKTESIVHSFAQKNNNNAYTPKDKKELLDLRAQITQLKPDLAIVVDYGLIIPQEIFEIPKYKTLNIHFSRLPDLRGASPVQHTILRGDKSAWITIQLLDKGLDTGDIILQKEVPLEGIETSESLYKKLFNIVSLELPVVINQYIRKEMVPQRQDHSKATYTKILSREDGFISPNKLNDTLKGVVSGDEIERSIRAYTPWPSAWTVIKLKAQSDKRKVENKRLKILKAHLTSQGETLQGKLVLDLVQLEGKNPVSWKQFKEGYPNFSF